MDSNKSNFTRRKFLAAAASGLATAGMVSVPGVSIVAQETKEETEQKGGTVIHRTLGKTGLKIPVISMGVMNANNPSIVQASYELGIRHFDTAAIYQYGRNEQMVGAVIDKMGVRDKVIIGTKIMTEGQRRGLSSNELKKKVADALDASLKRLRTDYVDILYIHSVTDPEEYNNPGLIEGLRQVKENGKAKFIGVSTHSNMAVVIDDVAEKGVYDVVLTSYNFTLSDDKALEAALKKAGKAGIGTVVMKAMAGGLRLPQTESSKDYSRATIASASLKWVLQNENVHTIIPGYDTHEHMKQDFQPAYNLAYTDEEREFLSNNDIRIGMGFCRQCRKCLASCPSGVEIPTLMRTHMYAVGYGNVFQARQTLNEIPRTKSIKICTDCKTCTAKCANSVDIAGRIEDLKQIYV